MYQRQIINGSTKGPQHPRTSRHVQAAAGVRVRREDALTGAMPVIGTGFAFLALALVALGGI